MSLADGIAWEKEHGTESKPSTMMASVREAHGWKLNYLFGKAAGYKPRMSWHPEYAGACQSFKGWQGYENAWGNPIPDYQGGDYNPKYLTELLDAGFKVEKAMADLGYKCYLITHSIEVGYGSTPTEAIIRAYVIHKLGPEVEVPTAYSDIPDTVAIYG